jgi:hypothetical protein
MRVEGTMGAMVEITKPSGEAREIPRVVEGARPFFIDRYMPTFDVRMAQHRVVDATPAETYSALRSLDFADVPSLMMKLGLAFRRSARARALRERGVQNPSVPRRITFDNLGEHGRILLAETPGFELLVGAVVELWSAAAIPLESSSDFTAFDRPGSMKAVGGFSLRPYGDTRTLLSYEARATGTDANAAARLRRAWILLEPLGTAAMNRVLGHVAAIAERARRYAA